MTGPARRLRFTAEALHEATEAIHWYRTREKHAADRFERAVVDVLASLEEAPDLGSPVTRKIRRRLLSSFPYAVLYEVDADGVLVLALMHTRRRPGYFRGRVG